MWMSLWQPEQARTAPSRPRIAFTCDSFARAFSHSQRGFSVGAICLVAVKLRGKEGCENHANLDLFGTTQRSKFASSGANP